MKEKNAYYRDGYEVICDQGCECDISTRDCHSLWYIERGFYLYFKSKDELLLATLRYYYDKIQNKMMDIDKESLLREKFEKQLYCQFNDIQNIKEFIIMHARKCYSV